MLKSDDPGSFGYPLKPSTCVMRQPFTGCDGYRHCPGALVDEWQRSVDPTKVTQVPPGAKGFLIGIPAGVEQMNLVPMYTSLMDTCVVEGLRGGYVPRKIELTDKQPPYCTGRECGADCKTTVGRLL